MPQLIHSKRLSLISSASCRIYFLAAIKHIVKLHPQQKYPAGLWSVVLLALQYYKRSRKRSIMPVISSVLDTIKKRGHFLSLRVRGSSKTYHTKQKGKPTLFGGHFHFCFLVWFEKLDDFEHKEIL